MTIRRALSLFLIAILSTIGVFGWLVELSLVAEAQSDLSDAVASIADR